MMDWWIFFLALLFADGSLQIQEFCRNDLLSIQLELLLKNMNMLLKLKDKSSCGQKNKLRISDFHLMPQNHQRQYFIYGTLPHSALLTTWWHLTSLAGAGGEGDAYDFARPLIAQLLIRRLFFTNWMKTIKGKQSS